MPLRQLTAIERQRMKRLTAESVDITLLQPTWTALDKGYMDATAPVRNYLKENGLHDFELQGRGARENGVKIDAFLVSEQEQIKAPASLYKPKAKPTKEGDPRIWFSKLHHHANPDDMLAVTEHDGQRPVRVRRAGLEGLPHRLPGRQSVQLSVAPRPEPHAVL